jgi:hypothetical protein
MSAPKRHHYLPEFYLKGFTRDELLWVFDRKTSQYRRQPPYNTAVIGHYYTTLTESGKKDYEIEAHLAQIEGEAKPIIGKLDVGEEISSKERVGMAYFLALLLCRTPKHAREVQEIGDAAHKLLAKEMIPTVEAAAELLRRSGKDSSVTPESMFRFIHEEQFQMKASREYTISTMLDQSQRFYKELALMNWFVAHTDGHASFITTDSPLGYVLDDAQRRSREPVLGFASEKIIKLVPLTCRTVLVVGDYGAGLNHFSIDRNQVREVNLAVATECERFVIGRDEALLRSVVPASKVDCGHPGSRMRVENIPHPTDPRRSYLMTRRVSADEPDSPLPTEVISQIVTPSRP